VLQPKFSNIRNKKPVPGPISSALAPCFTYLEMYSSRDFL